MSVLMTLRVAGDPSKLEAYATENPDVLPRVVARAKEHGVISHRFYGNDDEILVVDEWASPEDFQRFFDASPEIHDVMAAVGATGQPAITFWRKLDTGDDL